MVMRWLALINGRSSYGNLKNPDAFGYLKEIDVFSSLFGFVMRYEVTWIIKVYYR